MNRPRRKRGDTGKATDPRLPLSGQPIELHSLNANKVGVASDNLRTFSDSNTTIYYGIEFSAKPFT